MLLNWSFLFTEPASYYWFNGKCRHAMCECDSKAVKCFKRSKFDEALADYPKDECGAKNVKVLEKVRV